MSLDLIKIDVTKGFGNKFKSRAKILEVYIIEKLHIWAKRGQV